MISSFDGEHGFLSNFSDHIVVLKGRMFASGEHAYQACKTLDAEEQKQIQLARSPAQAKRLGRSVTLRPDWEHVKVNVMRAVIEAKFAEGTSLAVKLLETDDEELIEGNTWNDKFWGAVWTTGDLDKPEGFWAGGNMLGKLLMARREELRG